MEMDFNKLCLDYDKDMSEEVADVIKQKLITDAMDYLNQNMKQPFVEKGGEWSDI